MQFFSMMSSQPILSIMMLQTGTSLICKKSHTIRFSMFVCTVSDANACDSETKYSHTSAFGTAIADDNSEIRVLEGPSGDSPRRPEPLQLRKNGSALRTI
ncbi:hypothetical protein TNCV_2775471 [Trichonephila clavipes]|nr:hypothetical protein TNCV_2775471 [Trichonephila clavipes]